MPLPRASNSILRSGIRPAQTAAPLLRSTQIRTQTHGKDNLGGPGGQQPPPSKPGGASDILRRNWLVIGGAALAVLSGYAYLTRSPNEAKEQRDKALGEMSGRKKTGMGGFRNE